jgi:GNAT superfamily N-acetyltransferase
MVVVRTADDADFERIAAFYKRSAYRPSISPDDLFVVAEDEAGLCGALRIRHEEGALVLRGMRVDPSRQRQGIGRELLERAAEEIRGRECYCIPHRHLRDFYGQIGFAEVMGREAPAFLLDRARQYRDDYALDVILMRRPAGAG